MNPLDARRRLLGRNVYKKTVEGNPAFAQGSLARRYPGIGMQGWTEQAQYEGKNLLDNLSSEWNIGIGLSWGAVYDTPISVNANQKYRAHIIINEIKPNTKYSFKNLNKEKIWVDRIIVASDYGNGITNIALYSNVEYQNHDEYTFTTINDEKVKCVYFQVRTLPLEDGSTVPITEENIKNMKVCFNEGDPTYEPYTGEQPSPNPDYPQEITSAGNYNAETQKYEYEVKLTGGNLFDPSNNQKGYYTGIVGNAVSLNAGVGYSWLLECTDFTTGQYTISFNTDVNVRWRYYITDDKDVVLALYEDLSASAAYNYRTFELPDGAKKFCFSIIEIDSADEATIMFNRGSEVFPYEPYRLPQTVTITSDRQLTKWDKLEKRNGQWGWVYKSEEIESYTDESVPGEYFSTTGRLSTGAQVWYETTTETFVPLSESEQEQMNALYTFRPTTVLSNDCECNMTLTYKTKKSLEVAT